MPDPRIEQLRDLLPRAMLPDWVRLGARLVRLLRDQHHETRHDEVLDRLLRQAQDSVALRQSRAAGVPRLDYPPDLPITSRREEIVAAIRHNQVVVIAGETGSGKTTQLPTMCLEAGLGIEARIGCTQPRRVAALSISRRIAEELNVAWGAEVGCKIRFEERSSPETYIKLMTDGILLAETQGDPLLSEYNAIIIDEAHERSLNIDFLLGYLKGLLAKRPGLKLIITSATIDTVAFSKAFNDAPIIEVSGRVYPVEVVYAPYDATSEETGDMTYIDAAVRATEAALGDSGSGDVLIFMPSERDIRESADAISGRFGGQAEIIPLFGRLSSGDQQRAFQPSPRRKIVIATNIAETSLTLPGIKYVIDSGLARISRYNPRTRTKRLPIEPVSQSSANQRKGRSGRVQNGICVRLYSEEDFNARPLYTQPEIQRANLAEVILRMKAFRLGEIETFPFLNPPSSAAIQGGYSLLQELGALDPGLNLTPLGRDLARLPIDPTLGRMLLQSHAEHATRELLIIASGLSIQDPRERPLDRRDAADALHQRFADPQSDFLTLLNIWNAVHEQWETLRSQNQRRKFCKAHFLSYTRMREWQDLHAQLEEALHEINSLRLNESNAAYEAIHRSILAGLLGHVAMRKEANCYTGAGNRELKVFPGSTWFRRAEKAKKQAAPRSGQTPAPTAPAQPEWIVAGEIVETSQLFARTIAGIDPEWIVQLGRQISKVIHRNPHWSAAAGQVLAEEVTTLYGLEIRKRNVAFGNIDAKQATEIFIRSALVEGDPAEPANPLTPQRYPFLKHNAAVRQKIETWQTRTRRHDLGDLDQALFEFYARRLENVSSVNELNRFLRDENNRNKLLVTEADLVGSADLTLDADAFPDSVSLAGERVNLAYAYRPGEEHDGITLKLPADLAPAVSQAEIEWAVPGLREPQVSELLRSLPKAIRKSLMPLAPKAAEIARELRPGEHSLAADLSAFVFQRYGVRVPLFAWAPESMPPHLRPRIEIIDRAQKTVGTGRSLTVLREQLEKVAASLKAAEANGPDQTTWSKAVAEYERFGLNTWSFGDLPSRILVLEQKGEKLLGYPGLQLEEGHVHLRVFRNEKAAASASLGGIRRLIELAISKELAWLQKDLRACSRLAPLLASFCSADELAEFAFQHLKQHALPQEPFPQLLELQFTNAVAHARASLAGAAPRLLDQLESILKLRQEVRKRFARPAKTPAPPKVLTDFRSLGAPSVPQPVAAPASFVEAELAALLPKNFLEVTSPQRLPDLVRYLKALLVRCERAAVNPVKDRERAAKVAPYIAALARLQAQPQLPADARRRLQEFRWLIEEFKISVFAQELGTAVPVSPKRLNEYLEGLGL